MCSNLLKYHLSVIGVLMLLIAVPQSVQAAQCDANTVVLSDDLNETQPEKSTCAAIGTRRSDLVPPSTAIREPGKVGQAIIVVAGGARPEYNQVFSSSNKLARQMYSLLTLRGFTHDDIHYMNPYPPANDDGYLEPSYQDYDLKEPESQLTEAFDLAASRLKSGQQFVFYLHGHAEPNYFQIKEDYSLEAQYFSALLDKIPVDVQQVIILDTCYSGSFMDELQGGNNRIVVTSSDDKTDSWVADDAGFSGFLFPELRRDQSFNEAFQYATDKLNRLGKQFTKQQPWLDADSDGQVNTSEDYKRAAEIYLGAGRLTREVKNYPQVLMAGFDPMLLDKVDTQLRIVAVVEEGDNELQQVALRQNIKGSTYSFVMTLRGKIPLDETTNRYGLVYEFEYLFPAFKKSGPLAKQWFDLPSYNLFGGLLNQFYILARDNARQIHYYPTWSYTRTSPNLEVQTAGLAATQDNYVTKGLRRQSPQVIMAGLSPMKMDVTDHELKVMAIVRAGASQIESVTLNALDAAETVAVALNKVIALPNGDLLYEGVLLKTDGQPQENLLKNYKRYDKIWNEGFTVIVRDQAGQAHRFPDLKVGDFPQWSDE